MKVDFEFPSEFILFDFEYTAWEESQARSWSDPGEHREIIQIGAVRVGAALIEMDSFLVYVRPEKNPVLSTFISNLTGITQNDIRRKGIPFLDGLEKLRQFIGTSQAYCWGKDVEVLQENCEIHGAPFSIPLRQLTNLRPIMAPVFAAANVDIDAYSSGTLIQAFSDAETRRAHDALNDMRNLLEAIRQVEKYMPRFGTR